MPSFRVGDPNDLVAVLIPAEACPPPPGTASPAIRKTHVPMALQFEAPFASTVNVCAFFNASIIVAKAKVSSVVGAPENAP